MQNQQFAPPPPSGQQQPPRVSVPHYAHGGIAQETAPPVQSAPAEGQTFCRDCGQPVEPGSAVCVHCNYILNPQAFQQAQRLFRRRREAAEQQRRREAMMRQYPVDGMPDLEHEQRVPAIVTPEQVVQAGPHYHYETIGAVFCPGCGGEVLDGACQCVHCGYVIDQAQYSLVQKRVQQQLALRENREAKLSRKDLIKSLLVPGYGRKIYRANIAERPQVAKPARRAARVNALLLLLLLIVLIGFFGNL